jgi:hypothetical protein
MTIETKIAELKTLYPTLTKGIDDEVIVLDATEYEETIAQWAANEIAAEETLAAKEASKVSATAKLAALGLTTDDLKALGLGTN